MRKIATPADTFDEPWKQIVRALFQPFLEFFAPDIAEAIDWQREPKFLDKELRRIAKGLVKQRRSTADFLVQAWRRDGTEQWLIVHIELQAQREAAFAERMFVYNIRAYDLCRVPIVSLAVLADQEPLWRPRGFGYGAFGSRVEMVFPVVKLLDYREGLEALEQSENPFALAVLAHLKTQETKGDAEVRLAWKLRLARMLFDRRWTRLAIEELLQFIDWIMTLPDPLEGRFEVGYEELERTHAMAEMMPPIIRRAVERGKNEGIEIGKNEGIEIGKNEGIEIGKNEGVEIGALVQARALLMRLGRKRLGEPSPEVQARIEALRDRERLEQLCERAIEVESWEELLQQTP